MTQIGDEIKADCPNCDHDTAEVGGFGLVVCKECSNEYGDPRLRRKG